MASDFDFTGFSNNSANFVEKNTGVYFAILAVDCEEVELLDGDQVIIPAGGQRNIWSIRENRVIGYA
jgi:uncharacterized protein YjlB